MKRRGKRRETVWHRVRWLGLPAVVFLVLIVAARVALPYIVRDFVNDKLRAIPDYSGHVEKIRVNLWRGAYTIINLRIVKTSGRVPVPFITMAQMDLSVDWSALLRGALVAKITVDRPVVNFVSGPTEQQKQAGFHKGWKQTLESLAPFTINRFQVNDGLIRYLDPYGNPPVDIYITNLFATATNLTNVRHQGGPLPAGLVAQGATIGNGALRLELHMNPLANAPTFKLTAAITNMNLTALNNFLQAYAKFAASSGTFALLLDVAAAHERYQGYAKPFFFNLAVLSPGKEFHETPLQVIWDTVVAILTRIFRNQPYNQIATLVPISGKFQKGTAVDLWGTIGGILQNAFIQAFSPRFIRAVPLPANGSGAR